MKQFKIRASACHNIMGVRGLGKTGETYVDIWDREQIYGKRKKFSSKYTEKGTFMEEANIQLAGDFLGFKAEKNVLNFEDDYITGTPDLFVPEQNKVIDIKSSWDCFTFPLREKSPDPIYFYQLQCYMHLTGHKKSQLIYVLGDTPEHIIESEVRKLMYNGTSEDEAYDEVESYFDYSEIPMSLRIKAFDIDYDEAVINKIIERVKECRNIVDKLNEI